MTLKKARWLRDRIRENKMRCTVPLGHGADGYFVRVKTHEGMKDFADVAAWNAWGAEQNRRLMEWIRREQQRLGIQPRSPIEAMVDEACGL